MTVAIPVALIVLGALLVLAALGAVARWAIRALPPFQRFLALIITTVGAVLTVLAAAMLAIGLFVTDQAIDDAERLVEQSRTSIR